jgi:phosphatidylglycerophosphatase A
VALLLYIFLPAPSLVWLIVCLVCFFAGVWASKRVERDYGKDPGLVVIDEFVGQWLSLVFLPKTPLIFFMSFALFRLLDIIKPFPANDAQKLPHGWGIMTDDIISGIYTNIIIQIGVFIWKIW